MGDCGVNLETPAHPAEAAVKYLLDRIQHDADLCWTCGPGTQVFRLLVRAEAFRTRQTEDQVYKQREVFLGNGTAEVVDLRRYKAAMESMAKQICCPQTTAAAMVDQILKGGG